MSKDPRDWRREVTEAHCLAMQCYELSETATEFRVTLRMWEPTMEQWDAAIKLLEAAAAEFRCAAGHSFRPDDWKPNE